MIVAGFSAYSRLVDWTKFREIADSIGAYFMVDMAISTIKYAPMESAISLNFVQSTNLEYAENPATIIFGRCFSASADT